MVRARGEMGLSHLYLSHLSGICISKPLEVIVRKEFFIDLRVPYSAVKGEQIEVRAILHNYSPDRATVSLGVCSCSVLLE